MTTILGYWDIRGLAHPIRLLLEYTGTKYEDKRYVCGPGPDYDLSDWTKEKEKLGLDFPNIPYLIDSHVKLTQSNAILRYIARKHNMCGESESEITRVDLIENQAVDFRMELGTMAYNENFESLKGPYLEKLPGKLKQFSQFLGQRKWFAGDKITYADFLMYDTLDLNRLFEPKCLDPFSNLKNFLQRFEVNPMKFFYTDPHKLFSVLCKYSNAWSENPEPPQYLQALEKIAAYLKSSRFMTTPINMQMAKWGTEK